MNTNMFNVLVKKNNISCSLLFIYFNKNNGTFMHLFIQILYLEQLQNFMKYNAFME